MIDLHESKSEIAAGKTCGIFVATKAIRIYGMITAAIKNQEGETKMQPMTFAEVMKSADKQQEENTFSIYKTDDDKRLVFGWASIAIDVHGEVLEDRQQDIIDPEDLEEAVYEYVLNFRDTGEEHLKSMRKKGKLVESCVFTKEKQEAMGIPAGTIPVGWWIGFKIEDDDTWERVKNGTYRMFSIEGKANREKVEKADLEPTGCGVLVVRDGKVLTGTRIERGGRGRLCGPGGHIEDGETPEEAAVRETEEEFGIRCKELQPLGVIDNGTDYCPSAVFLCTEFDGEPETDEEEMTDVRWRTIEELEGEDMFPPFKKSLDLLPTEMSPAKRHSVAKTFSEILKFNPFHDAKGWFATAQGFTTYSANPKTKAGAMAISRSAQAGHTTTFNSHKESQGENVGQNYNWLNGGPGAKILGSQGQLASQQPKTPPKPTKNYDSRGFADQDDAATHQLYNGKQYYAQQKLTAKEQQAAANYLEAHTEPGSLYSHSQNLNYKMANGQPLTGKYKQTYDGIMSSMHNLGYNVELSRYDHADMVNGLLKASGAGTNYNRMSQSQLQKALVGTTFSENKFTSTSYNDFKNATNTSWLDTRAVKVTYKAKASTQAMMPGKGPGGDFGEMILAPNQNCKIVDVKFTGKSARQKQSQTYNLKQIEIVVEIG